MIRTMRSHGIGRKLVLAVALHAALVGCVATERVGGGTSNSASTLAWADVLSASPDASVVTDPQLREKITQTGLPWRVRDKVSGIEMLLVPPGEFVMGMSPGDPDAMDDERPAHEVVISHAYYLGRTEVTQGEWISVMGYNPSYFQEAYFKIVFSEDHDQQVSDLMASGLTLDEANAKAGAGDLVEVDAASWPVETLTPSDLEPYLRRTGLRLPTEAEWEFACRAGDRALRYGELDAIGWYSENSEKRTHPVGGKVPNALGFYDMIGNVWEWASDWYSSEYYGACENGATDPAGPAVSEFGVARGGSWDHLEKNCRASFRENHYMPDPRITDFGFRVARNP